MYVQASCSSMRAPESSIMVTLPARGKDDSALTTTVVSLVDRIVARTPASFTNVIDELPSRFFPVIVTRVPTYALGPVQAGGATLSCM